MVEMGWKERGPDTRIYAKRYGSLAYQSKTLGSQMTSPTLTESKPKKEGNVEDYIDSIGEVNVVLKSRKD